VFARIGKFFTLINLELVDAGEEDAIGSTNTKTN